MTQIILQIEDASILPALEKTLRLLKGVKVKIITDDIPSTKTLKALKEAKEGKVTRSKNSGEMFSDLMQ